MNKILLTAAATLAFAPSAIFAADAAKPNVIIVLSDDHGYGDLSITGNPLLGTGWGVPYQKRTSAYANYGAEWVLALYTPHNSILGLAVYAGLAGLCGIWLVVPVAAFLAAGGYRRSRHAVDRAAALTAVCILPAYGAQCYGDIGIQSFGCGLILGVALAVAGKVSAWAAVPVRVAKRGGGGPP